MQNVLLAAVVFAALLASPALAADQPAAAPGNSPEAAPPPAPIEVRHPRLFLDEAALERMRGQESTDPVFAALLTQVRGDAQEILAQPVLKNVRKGKETFLKQVARPALRRISTLALAWQLDRDERFLARAVQEMEVLAAMPDWSSGHFLDVAESATAFAIGYDWLYPALTPDQRTRFAETLATHALKPGIAAHKQKEFWVNSHSNWNPVCNGAIAIAAFAVEAEKPALASEALACALGSLPQSFGAYGPNGGYDEGPMYWSYGTTYLCLALDAIRSARGDLAGIEPTEGFRSTGVFPFALLGPSGNFFNYGDASEDYALDPAAFWLARANNTPHLATLMREFVARRQSRIADEKAGKSHTPWYRGTERFRAFELLWYSSASAPASTPMAMHFVPAPTDLPWKQGTETVVFRSSWEDPAAMFFGMKAGGNLGGRAHLDAGTFVFDADGVRWASQLGGDNYSLPDYFVDLSKPENLQKPYIYFRKGTFSKNTLVIANQNQNTLASCPVTRFSPEDSSAVADLSAAYAGTAQSVRRGVRLGPGRQAIIQDEIVGLDGPVRWSMMTSATVELAGNKAVLRSGDKSLSAEILEPAGAAFATAIHVPKHPKENLNDGYRQLITTIDPPADGKPQRIAIRLVPGTELAEAPRVIPLDQWPGSIQTASP